MIRTATTDDAESICQIYNYYISHTVTTFETLPVSTQEMKERIIEIRQKAPFFVALNEEEKLIGYAYLRPFHSREAFRHTMESSIYLSPSCCRQGYGKQLYQSLFTIVEQHYPHIHTLIACITLPNAGSVALHESFGFKQVGRFHEVGYKFDQWLDVGYWERINKRSYHK